LEAFVQFLENLPADTGMAFVFIQHLAPGRESALPRILARATPMRVREAAEGMSVRRNEVYVIPPGTTLTLTKRGLHLVARDASEGPHFSIDAFFRSLAAERSRCAIGVVFSGNAGDGTQGLEAIQAGGGVTFAQDNQAQFNSMPSHAIAAGWVDHVLAPAAIAKELGRIAGHAYFEGTDPAWSPGQGWARIMDLASKHAGVDFSSYEPAVLQPRIARRMLVSRTDSPAAYSTLLAEDPAELKTLCGQLWRRETAFFRDAAVFTALQRAVFPSLLGKRGEAARIWSIGCGSGEETYSLGMAFLEVADKFPRHAQGMRIFGTDLDEALLNRARRGLYPKSIAQEISPARLRRFFKEEPDGYRVAPELRNLCIFGGQNLLGAAPFSRMDLVSCRNVLGDLVPAAQKRLLPALHYALRPGGHLVLGAAESLPAGSAWFKVVDKKRKIFLRQPGPTAGLERPASTPRKLPRPLRRDVRALVGKPGRPDAPPQQTADRIMLTQYAPPGVLLDARFQVLEFRGVTDPYLTAPKGRASFHLLKVARPGLLLPLRAALERARRRNQPARALNVRVEPQVDRVVHLQVIPLRHRDERFFLVVFENPDSVPAPAPAPAPPRVGTGPEGTKQLRRRVTELERELRQLRDYLQSLQQQHDAAQGEMQSSMEEAQATNEELQSVNEELETSKEELQSSNEELMAVNEEMVHRVGELHGRGGGGANRA
jgi:two-component system CheB/CheR fusion protein